MSGCHPPTTAEGIARRCGAGCIRRRSSSVAAAAAAASVLLARLLRAHRCRSTTVFLPRARPLKTVSSVCSALLHVSSSSPDRRSASYSRVASGIVFYPGLVHFFLVDRVSCVPFFPGRLPTRSFRFAPALSYFYIVEDRTCDGVFEKLLSFAVRFSPFFVACSGLTIRVLHSRGGEYGNAGTFADPKGVYTFKFNILPDDDVIKCYGTETVFEK